MRKLATIQKILDIQPIPNADAIDVATVLGWKVVVKKGDFQIGDMCVYFEIDSWIPHKLAPFLTRGDQLPKSYENVPGQRLRTMKLRKTLSQGLILPITILGDLIEEFEEHIVIGSNVTELLSIQKYEAPIPACLAGDVKGSFPIQVPKTDEPRCISKGTLIMTNKGNIPIERIVDNPKDYKILSFNEKTQINEFKKITNTSIQSGVDEWVKITTKSDKKIVITPEHPIYLPDLGCYREIKELTTSDKLQIF